MQQISITEASEQLSQLIDAALAGEKIIIVREHHPVVKLTPLATYLNATQLKQEALKESSGCPMILINR